MSIMYGRLNDEDNYTKKEIMSRWGIGVSKLSQICKAEDITPVKLGKLNLYRGRDLNIYWDKLFTDRIDLTINENLSNKDK